MSIFTRIYNRINWKNSPDVSTPLNESNLNRMDAALYNLESEIIELSSSIQGMFTSLSVNPNTGVISIGKFNGTIVTVNTNLGKIAVNFEFDRTTQVLSLILKDGTREQVDLSAFITDTEFSDTVTIQHDRDENGVVHFFVKDHSIDDSKIQQGYLAKLQEQADRGYQYISETESNAQAAASSELSAKNYSESAEQKADDSNNFATLSESYCKGGTGTRQGEDTDNAKYYASEARKSASQGQVQSDWNETDESDPAYIKNKPNTFDIPDATDQVAGKMKLYGSTGQNEDGTITQKVISESLSRIGDLTGLNTNQKSNVVSAINEVNSGLGTVKDSLGTLTDLATTEKTNIVGAVNEVKNSIPVVPTLATVATSGSYNDLSDKPTIPSAQVQSDWNATTGVSAIKNKPSILSQSIISDAWDSTKTYAVNDYCIYNNSLWKCKVSNKNSTPVEGSNWTQTNITSELGSSNIKYVDVDLSSVVTINSDSDKELFTVPTLSGYTLISWSDINIEGPGCTHMVLRYYYNRIYAKNTSGASSGIKGKFRFVFMKN